MRYELIDNNNLILATRVHLEIFPNECAYSCFKKSIEDNHVNYRYYLVYKDTVIIGITGLYIDDRCKDNIWLGWYGVLKEYRLHGFGKQIFIDTLEMAEKWGKEKKIDTFRLYTSFDDNKDITKEDIASYIKEGATIIDVRSPQEYREGHVDGAISIPDYQIKNEIEKKIPNKDELIVVYCSTGHRSQKAQQTLEGLGYKNVYNVYEGIII